MKLENFPEVCFEIEAYNLIAIQKLWIEVFIVIAYSIKYTKRFAYHILNRYYEI